MYLMIDNYDSFVYNLRAYFEEAGHEILVVENDGITTGQIRQMKPEGIIISPGPKTPKDVGISAEVIRKFAGEIPILGVCLGHQAICEVFGATVTYAKQLMHGKQSMVKLDVTCPIFSGMPEEISAARYHSLAAKPDTIPDTLKIVGATEDGEVMAVAHTSAPVYGLQFHPESILTPDGRRILENFLADKPL